MGMSEQSARRLNYKQQPDTSSQTVRNGESYDLDTREHMDNGVSVQMSPNDTGAHSNVSQNLSDTRERLEADIAEYKRFHASDKLIDLMLVDVARCWLDRQAAITECELCGRCSPYATAKDYLDTIDSLTAERDVLKAKLETYGKVPDQDECKKQQPMESGDTREKLEADVRGWYSHTVSTLVWPPDKNKSTDVLMVPEDTVLSWLNRQEAITSSEWCWSNDALEEELTRKEAEVAELKAEVKKQRQRANEAERGVLSDEWYVARDRYEDDVAALTAERDELREALDACGTGTMYELWRKDHAQLEALRAAQHDKTGT